VEDVATRGGFGALAAAAGQIGVPTTGVLMAVMAAIAALCYILLFMRTSPNRQKQQSVLAADPVLTPGALRGYALALLDAQRLNEAEEALQAHVARLPGDARFQALLAVLAAQRGDHALAAATLHRAAQVIRHEGQQRMAPYLALVVIAEAVELEAAGQSAQAASCVQEAAAIDPAAPQARSTCMSQITEAARTSEMEHLAFEQLSDWYRGRLAPRAFGFGNANDAVRFFRGALRSHQGSARLLADYAQALHAVGDHNGAEKAYQDALRADQRDPWIHRGLAMLLWRLDRLNEAERELTEAAQLGPRSSAILGTLGLLLLRQERFAEAERVLWEAISIRPDVWVLAHLYATALLGQNKVPQAARAFHEAERLGANDADFRIEYASALLQLDQPQAAEEQYRLALRSDSHNGTAQARYGAFLFSQLRLDAAEEQLRQALVKPGGERAHTTLVGLYLMERRLDEAMVHLQSALAYEGSSSLVQEYQAEWLLLRGRAAEANSIAQRLREQGVSRGSLYLVLGASLLQLDRQLEAQAALREAVRLDPSLPATLLMQARALRQLGYLNAALETVAQALAVAPNWPEAQAEQQQLMQAQAQQRSPGSVPQRPRG
jgi:tetratricopeptide (TPR) repeat protein